MHNLPIHNLGFAGYVVQIFYCSFSFRSNFHSAISRLSAAIFVVPGCLPQYELSFRLNKATAKEPLCVLQVRWSRPGCNTMPVEQFNCHPLIYVVLLGSFEVTPHIHQSSATLWAFNLMIFRMFIHFPARKAGEVVSITVGGHGHLMTIYKNNSSTGIVQPGTAGSASATSPRPYLVGSSGFALRYAHTFSLTSTSTFHTTSVPASK